MGYSSWSNLPAVLEKDVTATVGEKVGRKEVSQLISLMHSCKITWCRNLYALQYNNIIVEDSRSWKHSARSS